MEVISENMTAFEKAQWIGSQSQRLGEIRLEVPWQDRATAAIGKIHASGIGRKPGSPTRGLRIIQPTGAGKSEAAIEYARLVSLQPGFDPKRKRIVHVTLNTTGTPLSAISSILEKLGDQYSTEGGERVLLKRLKLALIEEGVELLIIDELNHCSQKVLGKDVSNTLKNMLTQGWVPIVFLGTEDADRLFKGNAELRRRCASDVSLHPIDCHDVAQFAGWVGFLGGMDGEIHRLGLLPSPSGLQEASLAEALCIACGGLIGEVCAVIQDSFERVLDRGGRRIETDDLRQSVDIRYVQSGVLAANPLDHLP
jgi:hypothetical protein